MKKFFLDLFYPKRCVGCKKFGEFLCSNCFAGIEMSTFFACPVCLNGSIDGATHKTCKSRISLDGLIFATIYKGITKRLVFQFKYRPFLTSLTETMGAVFVESLLQNEQFYALASQKPLLVPIPLHPQRLRVRGYNHASLLCQYVAQYFSLEMNEDILIRTRNTKPQFKLKKDARISNISGAFEVSKNAGEKLKGRTILLIDDIATTCATLSECARVLKKAGAKEVWGITFAKEI